MIFGRSFGCKVSRRSTTPPRWLVWSKRCSTAIPRENRKRRTTLGWNCLTLSGVWNDPCLQPRISRIDLGSWLNWAVSRSSMAGGQPSSWKASRIISCVAAGRVKRLTTSSPRRRGASRHSGGAWCLGRGFGLMPCLPQTGRAPPGPPCEGGEELDPDTLAKRGIVGRRKQWKIDSKRHDDAIVLIRLPG
jgi:hypothetical protein